MPSSSALYFQGTMELAGGLGTAFGDGLRCAGGSVIRLGTKGNGGHVVVGGGGRDRIIGTKRRDLICAGQGNDVVLLEKAPEVGGTSLKAAFIYWVPNNGFLQEQGLEDREEDFLRYVARISRPEKYDPDSPTFGQSEWEFALYKAIYESAWPAAKLLHDRGALPAKHAPHWTDYWQNLEEDKVANARHLTPDGVN